MNKEIDVVGAVIVADGRVLCAQRGGAGSLAGKWEFPGGKIEHGESPRQALEREIAEELLCTIKVGRRVTTTSFPYDFATVNLTTFWCQLIDGAPRLTEHSEVRWVLPQELVDMDWAPADVPAVRLIEQARP